MALGNEIIISANPRGRFLEGIISGTPKPGTCMQLKAATEPVGGAFTYEVYDSSADGEQRPVIVLLADQLQGKTASDAYTDGQRGFLYMPAPGEELNMLVSAAGTGTGDSKAIGDLLMINDGDGLLIATTGSPESECFQVLETLTDVVAAGTLTRVMYTGH